MELVRTEAGLIQLCLCVRQTQGQGEVKLRWLPGTSLPPGSRVDRSWGGGFEESTQNLGMAHHTSLWRVLVEVDS